MVNSLNTLRNITINDVSQIWLHNSSFLKLFKMHLIFMLIFLEEMIIDLFNIYSSDLFTITGNM